MSLEKLTTTIDYGIDRTIAAACKIAGNPSAIKKLGGFIAKSIDLSNYIYSADSHQKPLNDLKTANDVIDFYGFFKDLSYWIKSYNEDTINNQELVDSLKRGLKTENGNVKQTVQTVLKESYVSQKQFCEALQSHLRADGYTAHETNEAVRQVAADRGQIFKSRPLIRNLSMAGFTILDFVSDTLALDKWKLIDLAQISHQIGHIKGLDVLKQLDLEKILGSIASATLILVAVEAGSKGLEAQRTLDRLNGVKSSRGPLTADELKQEEKARLNRTKAVWDLVTTGADLVATAVPLLLQTNKGVKSGLAVISKCTGLVALFVKP